MPSTTPTQTSDGGRDERDVQRRRIAPHVDGAVADERERRDAGQHADRGAGDELAVRQARGADEHVDDRERRDRHLADQRDGDDAAALEPALEQLRSVARASGAEGGGRSARPISKVAVAASSEPTAAQTKPSTGPSAITVAPIITRIGNDTVLPTHEDDQHERHAPRAAAQRRDAGAHALGEAAPSNGRCPDEQDRRRRRARPPRAATSARFRIGRPLLTPSHLLRRNAPAVTTRSGSPSCDARRPPAAPRSRVRAATRASERRASAQLRSRRRARERLEHGLAGCERPLDVAAGSHTPVLGDQPVADATRRIAVLRGRRPRYRGRIRCRSPSSGCSGSTSRCAETCRRRPALSHARGSRTCRPRSCSPRRTRRRPGVPRANG